LNASFFPGPDPAGEILPDVSVITSRKLLLFLGNSLIFDGTIPATCGYSRVLQAMLPVRAKGFKESLCKGKYWL
jgi:hypothetical protein